MPSSSTPARSLREPLLTYAGVIALAAAVYWAGLFSPALHRWVPLLVAFAFVYGPSVASRLSRQPFSFEENGFTFTPVGPSLAVLAAVVALTFPPFIGGFFVFYDQICRVHPSSPFAAPWARLCARWHPEMARGPLVSGDLLVAALNQLVVVAFPEELFFRAYLMSRLEERWPPRTRFLGAAIGRAWFVQAALFALGHVLVDLNPQRFAVFFPALLFGWMRARSGSILAGALYHALCNVLSDVLHTRYFG